MTVSVFAKVSHFFQSSILLLACLVYVLIRGRATRVPKGISCVAIMQISKVGDMVLVTPLFRAVKEKYPSVHVLVVGGEGGKRVLEGHPDVDEIVVYQNKPFELIRELRSKRIDFAVLANPSPEVLAAFFLAGVPLISAFTLVPSKRSYVPLSRLYRILLRFVVAKPLYIGEYWTTQCLTLLEPIGITEVDTHLRLSFAEESAQAVRGQLKEYGIELGKDLVVAIAPGGKKIRQWPAERFAQLANHLYEHYGAKIILVGAGQDSIAIESVKDRLSKGVVCVNMFDQTLNELKALTAQTDLLVANDSGPVTFAEAFGTPSVMIVGPTDEKEHHYADEIHKMVVAPTRGEPVTYIRNWLKYDQEEALRQIQAVSFEQVRDTVDALLKSRGIQKQVVR